MFVPSRTYRITYDDSWFDSAEKQKIEDAIASLRKALEGDNVEERRTLDPVFITNMNSEEKNHIFNEIYLWR